MNELTFQAARILTFKPSSKKIVPLLKSPFCIFPLKMFLPAYLTKTARKDKR